MDGRVSWLGSKGFVGLGLRFLGLFRLGRGFVRRYRVKIEAVLSRVRGLRRNDEMTVFGTERRGEGGSGSE